MNDINQLETQRKVPPRAGRREWIGLIVLMLPTLLIAMDMTVLHLAVPALTADLGPSSSQLLWIVDIYSFMIAGTLITMGTLGDRIGRRRLLLLGAAGFGIASLIAAYSTTAEMLIASRALLGLAGATLMPSTMSLIRTMFLDDGQRTAAIGVWVSGFSVGSAIGPLVGGLLLVRFWWGSVFLVGLPVMVLLLVLGPLILPEHKDPNPGRFDLISAIMSLAAVLLVIYALKRFAENGFELLPIAAGALGLIVGIAFVRRQRRLENPLIDVLLFRSPSFNAALITYSLALFASFGTFLYIAQYLQLVIGLSPLQAGLWSLPGAFAFIAASNLAPKFAQHIAAVILVMGGLLVAATALGMLTQVGTDSLALVVLANTLTHVGFGFTFTLTVDMVIGSAPPDRAGAASGLVETGAELGGALGLALLGSLGVAVYRGQMATSMPTGIPTALADAAHETLGGAVAAASELPFGQSAALVDAAQQAFISGMHLTALISTVTMICLAILFGIMMRKPSAELVQTIQPFTAHIHADIEGR